MELKISRLVNQQTNIDQGRVAKRRKDTFFLNRLFSLGLWVTDNIKLIIIGKNAPNLLLKTKLEKKAHNRGEKVVSVRGLLLGQSFWHLASLFGKN